jgi:hypothetical protein
MKPPSWILKRPPYTSPEEQLINRCSKNISATTISDPLPERLNVFANKSAAERSGAFIAVSSVDQRMVMQRTGPYWQAYITTCPDLRFVGSSVRIDYGLVTFNLNIRTSRDLVGKRIGLFMRPSPIRALQEIVLLKSWDIYDQITIKEYSPTAMASALDRNEVDVIFMPVARMSNDQLRPMQLDLGRSDLNSISLSVQDVVESKDNSPVLTERVTLPASSRNPNHNGIGLITFDVAWFTFSSTPDGIVTEFVSTTQHACSPRHPNCKVKTITSLLRWPQLKVEQIHPGALKLYRDKGV